MNLDEFKSNVKEFGIILNDRQIIEFSAYLQLLITWNKVMDLTAILEEEQMIEKHFYDSLLSAKYIDYSNQKIIDVGSGAGFPGLVLKIAFPNLSMVLLEPTTKRANFLHEVINKLQLQNIEIVNQRAEEWIVFNREKFDLATARAVAPLNILLELVIPYLKVNGKFVCLKGSKAIEEISQSKQALFSLNATVLKIEKTALPSEQENRTVIIIQKNAVNEEKYPRNYGAIKKRPL